MVSSPAASPLALRLALGLAAAALGVWLWSRVCAFPEQPWNDLRVAPTVALAQGWSVYPTAESGTINTWTYGPLPLLAFWPAAWASTAGGAMLVAALLNLLVAVVPIALVCRYWPGWDAEADTGAARAAAFFLCLALWPERQYLLHSADNLAIALGLLGNLVLIRARSPVHFWLAAALATAAIACKQTAAGLPLAQALWLALTAGRRAGFTHAMRCGLVGVVILLACVIGFGREGLAFVLLELPAHFRWAHDPWERFMSVRWELLAQVGVPLALMLLLRRFLSRPPAMLAALAWACALPLGGAALFKYGGRMNSVYAYMLWLPPALTLLLTARLPSPHARHVPLASALLAGVLACTLLAGSAARPLRPQLAAYDEAAALAARLPGQIWFPHHPLVTLYSEHRYYHDEDGLYVRRMTHKAVTAEHAAAGLPPSLRVMAFHAGWSDWMTARKMMPEGARTSEVGHWSLLTAPASP